MKFTIIGLPTKNIGNQYPNLGAITIAQRVREIGHEVNLIDVVRYRYSIDEVIEQVKASKPDLVGLSGIITSYHYFEPLAVKLKQTLPGMQLVVGGGITCIAELIEEYTEVDYIVKGEGDIAITELISMLESDRNMDNADISGLFVRVGKKFKAPTTEQYYPDISNLNFPAYDLFDMNYYIQSTTQGANGCIKLYPKIHDEIGDSVRFFPIVLTRGCPYNCSFCYRLIKKHRHPTIENAIAHLKTVKDKYGCSGINLLDELAVVDRNWFMEFCEAIASEVPGLKIFTGSGRVNLLTDEIIAKAKKAGFVRFGCGIESGSPKILKRLNKKVTVEQNRNAIISVKAAGMMATCNFIFGSPGEDKESLKETESFIRDLLDPKDYAVNLTIAYPGTPLFDYAIENGILEREKIHEYVMNLSFGNYPLNLSEFKNGEQLYREVYLMQFRLELRTAWKKKQYKEILNLIWIFIRINISYLLFLIFPKILKKIRVIRDNKRLFNYNKKIRSELQALKTTEYKPGN